MSKDNFYKRERKVLSTLRTSSLFDEFTQYLEDLLENERETYETTSASEVNRGRIWMLRDLIGKLKKDK